MEFKEGQLIIHKRSNGYEIGKIKKIINDKRAWIWYTLEDAAELTNLDSISPILNNYCIADLLNKF